MDDSEIVKLVERVVRLEGRVAELEKRHTSREVIGQVRGLEQHVLRRLEALEANWAEVARSGLLDKSFWRRVLTIAGYMAVVFLVVLLVVLILWGLLVMAAIFLPSAGVTYL